MGKCVLSKTLFEILVDQIVNKQKMTALKTKKLLFSLSCTAKWA